MNKLCTKAHIVRAPENRGASQRAASITQTLNVVNFPFAPLVSYFTVTDGLPRRRPSVPFGAVTVKSFLQVHSTWSPGKPPSQLLGPLCHLLSQVSCRCLHGLQYSYDCFVLILLSYGSRPMASFVLALLASAPLRDPRL